MRFVNDYCDFMYFDSPAGTLTVAEQDTAVVFIGFGTLTPPGFPPGGCEERMTPFLRSVRTELDAWFSGRLRRFTVPVRLTGTPFQLAVSGTSLLQSPTVSAGVTATLPVRSASRVPHARSAGLQPQPRPDQYPCHRVIGSTAHSPASAVDSTTRKRY